MTSKLCHRRDVLLAAGAFASAVWPVGVTAQRKGFEMFTVHTFGDSILDCGHYNAHRIHPGALLVRNDDKLFPEFAGRDLVSARPATLVHRAVDGATVEGLERQAAGLRPSGASVALLTVGGNDLIRGLAADKGPGVVAFEAKLSRFLKALPINPVFIGTVYDPTFGDDARNFLGVPPAIARANHRRINAILGEMASRHGALVDLHQHFLSGDPSWFVNTIEPSLKGASEVRRAFLDVVLGAAGVSAAASGRHSPGSTG